MSDLKNVDRNKSIVNYIELNILKYPYKVSKINKRNLVLYAGANFASSPGRILIHCLDPVFLCEKIAYSNIDKVVSIQEATENTITGINGIGGLQTRGKYREGFPKSNYQIATV